MTRQELIELMAFFAGALILAVVAALALMALHVLAS